MSSGINPECFTPEYASLKAENNRLKLEINRIRLKSLSNEELVDDIYDEGGCELYDQLKSEILSRMNKNTLE